MFQNNPLLSQLKQQIRDSKQQVEGIVKVQIKPLVFLSVIKKLLYSPAAMKKVMHGDKIKA